MTRRRLRGRRSEHRQLPSLNHIVVKVAHGDVRKLGVEKRNGDEREPIDNNTRLAADREHQNDDECDDVKQEERARFAGAGPRDGRRHQRYRQIRGKDLDA